MKILACLSESYIKGTDGYYAKATSALFLQKTFGTSNVYVVSPYMVGPSISGCSSFVLESNFYSLPHFSTIKEFIKKSFSNPKFFISYLRKSNEILDLAEYEFVWTRNPSLGSLIFSICALKKNKRVLNHMCANAMSGWNNEKYNRVEKILGYCFSHVIKLLVRYIATHKNTINFCTGDELYNYCKKYNINTHQFVDLLIEPSEKQLEAENTPTECKKYLFIGRIQRDKGIHELCEAFSDCKLNNVSLTVVGDGPDFKYLSDRYSSKIEFSGQLPHSQLDKLIDEHHCIIVPSKNSYEGFPRVIMESWSYSKPVIVSNAGGVKAFVKHEINGLLMDDVSKNTLIEYVTRLTSSPKLYKSLIRGSISMKDVSTREYWINRLRGLIKND